MDKRYNVTIHEIDGTYILKGGGNVTMDKAKELVRDWLGLDEEWKCTCYEQEMHYDENARQWTTIFGGQIFISEIK